MSERRSLTALIETTAVTMIRWKGTTAQATESPGYSPRDRE